MALHLLEEGADQQVASLLDFLHEANTLCEAEVP
jgi:hypothetical protein